MSARRWPRRWLRLRKPQTPETARVKARRLAAPLLVAALAVLVGAGCAAHPDNQHEVVVGSASDPESTLLAGVYLAALRSYGVPAHTQTAANPMGELDSGAFTVVPVLTGQMLQMLRPGATA